MLRARDGVCLFTDKRDRGLRYTGLSLLDPVAILRFSFYFSPPICCLCPLCLFHIFVTPHTTLAMNEAPWEICAGFKARPLSSETENDRGRRSRQISCSKRGLEDVWQPTGLSARIEISCRAQPFLVVSRARYNHLESMLLRVVGCHHGFSMWPEKPATGSCLVRIGTDCICIV